MSVAEAMKVVMSAGAVLPGSEEEQSKTLLDRIEEWLKPKNKPSAETEKEPEKLSG